MESMADVREKGVRPLQGGGRYGGKIDTALIIEAIREISVSFKFECMRRDFLRHAIQLKIDLHCPGFLYDLTNPIEVSGIATSANRAGLLDVICVTDGEELSLSTVSVRSNSGERFSGSSFDRLCA
jgi:hypothetical protein